MAHDVFVSHSVKDKAVAEAIVARLEAEAVTCWIAPRDVVPGSDWGESIIDAIESSRIMILLFSQNANASPQIKREVERAVNKGVYIIPFRVEDIPPTRALEYFISTSQWMDAFSPPLERHLDNLAKTVRAVLKSPPLPGANVPAQPEKPSIPKPPTRPSRPKSILIAITIAALVIVGGAGWCLVQKKKGPPEKPAVTPTATSTPVPITAAAVTPVPTLLPTPVPTLTPPSSPTPFPTPTTPPQGPKRYQLTGVILEANDSMIAVQKGNDRWEIARDSNTTIRGDLKIGAKVTVTYVMTASEVGPPGSFQGFRDHRPRAYQATGAVLEVNDSMIAFQKQTARWEVARNSNTNIRGDLKIGAKVTMTYMMTATDVEVKPDQIPPITKQSQQENGPSKEIASSEASPSEETTLFVENFVRSLATNDLDTQLRYYADPVNYYELGQVTKDVVRKDLKHDISTWPNRSYSMKNPPRVTADGSDFVAEFPMTYTLTNPKGTSSGTLQMRLRLKPQAQTWQIVGIQKK